MDDFELEQRLRRYQPVAPSPHLRARVLVVRPARTWPCLAAAAALLLVVIGVDYAGRAAIERTGVMVPVDTQVAAAASLAEFLGGGPEGDAAAGLVFLRQRWQAEQETPPAEPVLLFAPGASR